MKEDVSIKRATIIDELGYKPIEKYSVAPYNFVSLEDKAISAYKTIDDLPKHDVIDEKFLSGYIEYEIVSHTPLIIGDEKKDKNSPDIFPFKNCNGDYVIPGNTIRGMVRSNLATLSFSNISDDIMESTFYYRDFGTGKGKDDYKKSLDICQRKINNELINAPQNMKGGFIYKNRDGSYIIEPIKEINEHTYFTISEQYLRRAVSKEFLKSEAGKKISFMYDERISELIINRDKYKVNKKEDSRDTQKYKLDSKKYFLKDIKSKCFEPYITEVSFDVKEKRTISRIDKRGVYKYNGYLMCSSRIDGKLVHYIIPQDRNESKQEIVFDKDKKSFIDFYIDDLLRTKKFEMKKGNLIAKNRKYNYYELPNKPGKENGKPIFYGEFENQIYMGFTPYLRIPYKYSTCDGISENYRNCEGISYMESLFGFVNKKVENVKYSYKSRLSFEDSLCIKKNDFYRENFTVVLSGPHASSYASYLKQDINASEKEIKNYNSDSMQIRGVKNYWIKDFIGPSSNTNNDNIESKLHPLGEGSIFKGKINYKNLRQEELGLLLWSLKVDPKARENIGMGKPYGFGHIEIKNINVYKEDIKLKYSSMSGDYFKKISFDDMITSYKKFFEDNYGINLDKAESINDLITMKTNIICEKNKNDSRYMRIKFKGVKEFTKLRSLPNPKETISIMNRKLNLQDKAGNAGRNHREKDNYKANEKKVDYNKGNNKNNYKNDYDGCFRNNGMNEALLEQMKNNIK